MRESDFIFVWTFLPEQSGGEKSHEFKITFSLVYWTEIFNTCIKVD